MLTDETVDDVRQRIEASPKKSIRKLAAQTGLSFSTSISLYFMLVCVRIEIVSQRENIHDIVNVCNFFSTKTNELSTIPTPAGEVIYWSMCKVGSSCPKESVICLKTDAPTESLVNLGKGFTFLFDGPHDGSSFSLQAEHSEQCRADKTRNYTTYVSFDEKLMKPFVQYKNNDRCVFDIRIPDSTAETSCTKKVDGFLLDFRRLTNDWIVSTAANRTFVLNLCGPAKACDDQDVATCARSFSGSVVDVWGDASTRRITYENGVVRFQFHHGTRSNRLSTKIEVRCKWGVSYGPASYLTPPASSPKLSKFVIESNLGCVKLPMNCKMTDSM
ncbi:putative actin binding protein [Trypoxylus dichotomus]